MLVHELKKNPGTTRKAKRLGRGNASGKGNSAGRGLNGQNSRSGGGVPHYFEGGQTPLNRRLPKLRGFKRADKLKTNYQVINITKLDTDERVDGTSITKEQLKEFGYIRSVQGKVKVLGNGKLSKKLNFDGMDAASAGAIESVTAAGGKLEIQASVVEKTEKSAATESGDPSATPQEEE